ncbi:ABC transporter substrate-binding protein [Litorisediminicola beolgyonensis]|uniref:ABC transporter substrate-binding protein n=1 Tax=Litorisediminicola beolgyonensis TaxID=1173614 RepID=A0ABW3ZHW8_9RHOB
MRLAFALLLTVCLTTSLRAEPEDVALFGAAGTEPMVLRSTTDIAIFAPVLEAWLETRPATAVRYEQWGSNALFDRSRTECHEGDFEADMVISSGVHQMVMLVNEACAQPYTSDLTLALPERLNWRDELWGITREPAVMVYDRSSVPPEEVPVTRFDLLDLLRSDPGYRGRVATYDIEASGLGYLFAFSDARQATTFGALLEGFGRAGAVATCCSVEIIRGVAEGRYRIAYNVLGSYAQGAAAADPRLGIVLPADYTLVLSRALMIPKGADRTAEAQALLDYLLGPEGRAELERQRLISPLLDTDVVAETGALSETALRPIALAPTLLVALDRQTRAGFIARWRESLGPQ